MTIEKWNPYSFIMVPFDEYIIALGSAIRDKREQAGMSLRAFGLMTGIHHNQLLLIEKGKTNPSLKTLYKIAEGLDTELVELVDR